MEIGCCVPADSPVAEAPGTCWMPSLWRNILIEIGSPGRNDWRRLGLEGSMSEARQWDACSLPWQIERTMINDWRIPTVMKCPGRVGLVTQRARAPRCTPSALDGKRDIPAGKLRSAPRPCRDNRALPSALPAYRTASFRVVHGSGRAFAYGSGCP